MKSEIFCNKMNCGYRWFDNKGYQRCSYPDNIQARFYFRCPYTKKLFLEENEKFRLVSANLMLPKISRRYGTRKVA